MESIPSEPMPDMEYINFKEYLWIFKRRWKIVASSFLAVVSLAIVSGLSQEAAYEATTTILIKRDKTANLTGLENNIGEIEVLSQNSDPVTTKKEILKSRPLLSRAIIRENLINDQNELVSYDDAIKNLTVESVAGTELLNVKFRNRDPVIARDMANRIVNVFKINNTNDLKAEATAAKDFISQQLPQVENSVRIIESELREFKLKNNITDLPRDITSLMTQSDAVGAKSLEISTQIYNIRSQMNELSKVVNLDFSEALELSNLSQSGIISQVVRELLEVRLELVNQRTVLSSNNPVIIELTDRETQLYALLNKELTYLPEGKRLKYLNNLDLLNLSDTKQQQIQQLVDLGGQLSGLKAQLINLNNNRSSIGNRLEAVPYLETTQRDIERRLLASQSTYNTLLSKLQEIQVTEKQTVGNVRVISPASIPELPISSNRKMLVAISGIGGLLLGIGIALLIDILDKSIKNLDEVKRLFEYPILAIVPQDLELVDDQNHKSSLFNKAGKKKTIGLDKVKIYLNESIQMLRASLTLHGYEKSNKIITITSSVPQEGKSFISSLLCEKLVENNTKVLLIDADLRRSQQHKIWNIDNNIGLGEILCSEATFENSVQHLDDGLDLLTAGNIQQSPVSLIISQEMKNLLEFVNDLYDLVVIDCPPVNGVAETGILGKLSSGTLLVVRPGTVDHTSAKSSIEKLEGVKQNIIGLVVNGVDCESSYYESFNYYAESDNLVKQSAA